MKILVAVSGAKTFCNQAVNAAARGEVIGTCDVEAAGCDESILTESDKVVPANIQPLPTDCKILSGGCLFSKPTPCLPVITKDWNITADGVGDTDEPVLTERSYIMCDVGGKIEIKNPNQDEISVGFGTFDLEDKLKILQTLSEDEVLTALSSLSEADLIDVLDGVLGLINEDGGTVNCGNIIDGVVAFMRGEGIDKVTTARDGSWAEINERLGTNIDHSTSTTFEDIFDDLDSRGHGSMTLISSGSGGHVTVAVNVNGSVGIMEGQDWGTDNPSGFITNPEDAEDRYGETGVTSSPIP